MTTTPWYDPAWHVPAEADIVAALSAAGRPPNGPVKTIKSTGRSCIQTVSTERGIVWIKHGYALPPGEERVLRALAERWLNWLPGIVATWPGSVAMEPLPGRELDETHLVDDWIGAARALAELLAGEFEHVNEWVDMGVRDRRPVMWSHAVGALRESAVVRAMDADVLRLFDGFLPEFVSRYVEAFSAPATLVPQDSGCCNIRITTAGAVFFDWADVVIGHPVFSCDRLLDQVPIEYQESVIEAFLEPLTLTRESFELMRRFNVLHEVLRYHDELAYVEPGDVMYESLVSVVQSQIRVLVEHESRRRV